MFYNTLHLTLQQKKDICFKAKEVCTKWSVDKLDCKVSFMRQTIKMPFEEIMDKLQNDSSFIFIHRSLPPENFLEIGFRATETYVDYFLFIEVDPKYIPELSKDLQAVPETHKPFEVGDLVKAVPPFALRCGTGTYGKAVITSVEPLVAVSVDGTMLWRATITHDNLEIIGKAPFDLLKKAVSRWENDRKQIEQLEKAGASVRAVSWKH